MRRLKKLRDALVRWIPLGVGLLYVLLPLYWAVVTAFKLESNVLKKPTQYIPNPFTLDNFTMVWQKSGFSRYFLNTIIVSSAVAIIVMVLAMFAAYGISRYKFRGKKSFFVIVLVTQIFPGAMLIIPLFMIFNTMGLINSLWSLIISYTAINVTYNVVLMKSFVDSIPREIEEAALIDGCNQLSVITRIVFPLLVPGAIAIATVAFMDSWNGFIFPIMFINNSERFVVTVGLVSLIGQNTTYYGALAAGSLIAMSVPIVMFAFFQKYIVRGLSTGAVKS